MKKIETIIGISLFWLGLSMMSDGINSLVLPAILFDHAAEANRATTLGLLTFLGLLLGMVIQPLAGALSDQLRPFIGRKGAIGIGLVMVLASLALLGSSAALAGLIAGYLAVQVFTSLAQAAQQGFIPDLIPVRQRGIASGLKNLMDIGGAMLGFLLLGQLLGTGMTPPALGAVATFLVVTYVLTLILVREPRKPLPKNIEAFHQPGPWMITNPYAIDVARQRHFLWLVLARFLFLLGTFAIGRFLLYFVVDRLGMDAPEAAEEAGFLLAGLALITVISALPAGWAADRFGRMPLMVFGAITSAAGALLLIRAQTSGDILIFGALMSLGSAAFSVSNWAMTTDVIPHGEGGRYMGLANFGTAGAAAVAGLFGPLIDWGNAISAGTGYTALFVAAAVAFLSSALALRGARMSRPVETARTLS